MLSTIPESPSDSSSTSEPSFKRHKTRFSKSWDPRFTIKVHIIQAKLDVQAVDELYSLIDSTGSLCYNGPKLEHCGDASHADVIISNISMRKRLERHVDWKLAQQKVTVTPQWLRDSVHEGRPLPYADYTVLKGSHDSNDHHRPYCEDSKFDLPPNVSPHPSSLFYQPQTSKRAKSNYFSRFACARASPLVCPNQDLVTEIAVLSKSRELEGKHINALSYERAIAVLKAYPYAITLQNLEEDVQNLPYLGEKILFKIKEFLNKGTILESQTIRTSEKFQILSTFMTVHGVGPSTARHLFDTGLRTTEDMERYYNIPKGYPDYEEISDPGGKQESGPGGLPELTTRVALSLRKDFQAKISRAEAEEIHVIVMTELEMIRGGCVSIIVGGYRRGKPESNDLDIVISHPNLRSGEVKGLCASLVEQLHNHGLVTHIMRLSGFHAYDSTRDSHWNSLEKALTVFRLPSDGKNPPINRRLDLIFASSDAYWTAVVGWTGSKTFERDLRLWAKTEKGMKFDSSGLTRRRDSKPFFPKSEREVFDILGLNWIDPTLRNADL
ncbi:hypothetical protein BDZ94DRAFT_1215253 [Collybia nuda]|uniref:DNA-directed DNA polymerase n=1 Tax=Collybia nuda TaxID=64659 RepID=A0A9P6CGE3_9AGAR|nr:hypothetical protein BDZ94DRAFT_1215253 [Collybia nuda]